MISTITTATVSTITTGSLAGSFALIGTFVLFALLLQKELAGSSTNNLFQRLSRSLNVAVFPMLIAFLMIVFFKVAEVLR